MKRKANIELLRIISMLMIVYHHYSVHSKWIFPEQFSNRQYFIELIGSFGKIGVVLFVLITGYFLKDSTLKRSKLITLWKQVTFYSITIYLIFLFLGEIGISKYIWVYIFPIPLSLYWFPTVYFFLYLLLPMLKNFVTTVEKNKLLKFLVMFIIATRIPTVLKNITNLDASFQLSHLALLIVFTLIGYLIKEFETELTGIYKRLVLIIFMFSLICIIIGPILINFINKTFSLNFSHYFFAELSSINTIIFSICLFALFLRFNINSKLIVSLGSCIFAVLLIHDNPIIRDFLWITTFKNAAHFSDPWPMFILRTLIQPLLVFILCIGIELIRKTFMNLLVMLKSRVLQK